MAVPKKPLPMLVLVIVVAVAWYLKNREPTAPEPRHPPEEAPRQGPGSGGSVTGVGRAALQRAIAHKQSKVWVEGSGRIVHLLPEDRRPPRHQLCLVELNGGHTIKISHNTDLAPKVPWRKGDELAFRGRFEWNAKGGVVHWTHHDPKGRKAGGWLEHAGKRYR